MPAATAGNKGIAEKGAADDEVDDRRSGMDLQRPGTRVQSARMGRPVDCSVNERRDEAQLGSPPLGQGACVGDRQHASRRLD